MIDKFNNMFQPKYKYIKKPRSSAFKNKMIFLACFSLIAGLVLLPIHWTLLCDKNHGLDILSINIFLTIFFGSTFVLFIFGPFKFLDEFWEAICGFRNWINIKREFKLFISILICVFMHVFTIIFLLIGAFLETLSNSNNGQWSWNDYLVNTHEWTDEYLEYISEKLESDPEALITLTWKDAVQLLCCIFHEYREREDKSFLLNIFA